MGHGRHAGCYGVLPGALTATLAQVRGPIEATRHITRHLAPSRSLTDSRSDSRITTPSDPVQALSTTVRTLASDLGLAFGRCPYRFILDRAADSEIVPRGSRLRRTRPPQIASPAADHRRGGLLGRGRRLAVKRRVIRTFLRIVAAQPGGSALWQPAATAAYLTGQTGLLSGADASLDIVASGGGAEQVGGHGASSVGGAPASCGPPVARAGEITGYATGSRRVTQRGGGLSRGRPRAPQARCAR